MFVLLFVYVFGGAVRGLAAERRHATSTSCCPGIFVQSVAFRATQTAVGLSEDLERGVVDRFRSMPMARSAVLIGRTVADLVRNVLIIGLMIVVGYLIGFRFHAGTAAGARLRRRRRAFGLRPELDLRLRRADRARRRGGPVGRLRRDLPARLRELGVRAGLEHAGLAADASRRSSPVTLTANTARSYALSPGVPSSLGGAAAWIGGLLAVFIPLCVWRYRRMS